MCFGIPMQVQRVEEGFAWVRDDALPDAHLGANFKRVETQLIETPKIGDWLLIFIDSAREIISPERAQEVKLTHELLAQAMAGATEFDDAVNFVLPSQMPPEELTQLVNHTTKH